MLSIILKYIGIPVGVILLALGIWQSGNIYGKNTQINLNAALQLSLQKKYDAQLLIKTIAINDVMESYNQTVTSIALSNLKSKKDLEHDKDFINKHTVISTVFVRDSSPTSMSSSSSNTESIIDRANSLSESTAISNPWRVSNWAINVTTHDWECVAQLNSLIKAVKNNNR